MTWRKAYALMQPEKARPQSRVTRGPPRRVVARAQKGTCAGTRMNAAALLLNSPAAPESALFSTLLLTAVNYTEYKKISSIFKGMM